MSHDDEDLDHLNADVVQFFKNLFKSKAHFWQQLKLLVTPEDEYANHHAESTIKTLIDDKKDDEEEDDAVEYDEVDPDIATPALGRSAKQLTKTEEEQREEELKEIIYNKAVPLTYIKDFHQETNRKVLVHPPKKKVASASAEATQPSSEEPSAPPAVATDTIDNDQPPAADSKSES